MTGRRIVLRAGVFPAAVLACYRHVPTTVEQVTPGDYVRAVILADRTDAAAGRGARQMATIRGTMLGREGGRISFSVAGSRVATPFAPSPAAQQVSVSEGDILRVDLRRLDAARTGGFVALVLGAAIIATVTGSRVVGGGPGPPVSVMDDSRRGVLQLRCCR